MDSYSAALVERHAETRASRLPCGSLRTRNHGPHVWTGQTYGQRYTCPGYDAIVGVRRGSRR